MFELTSTCLIQRIDTEVCSACVEDEVVLLQSETQDFYHLNNTGADLWRWLSEPKKMSELTCLLSQKYGAPPERFQEDVREGLGERVCEE